MPTTIALGTSAGGIGTRILTPTFTDTSTVEGTSGVVMNLPLWSNANSPIMSQQVALVAGDNTITVPTTAAWVSVIPPTNSSNAKTFRISGATGQSFHAAAGLHWAFLNPPPASFIVNSAGGETVGIHFG